MKAEAAIYLPIEDVKEQTPDYEFAERANSEISTTLFNAHIQKLYINTRDFCKNLSYYSKTELAQRYILGALTNIINGEPVTNRTMLDSLFNTYAPALNATLEQTGYNSITAMKDAAMAGNINAANFIAGFANGLNAIEEEKDLLLRNPKYGEEIPIDIVEMCKFGYNMPAVEHKVPLGQNAIDYIKDISPVNMEIDAHVKNEYAEVWAMNDFSNKIVDAMLKKEFVILRIGKTIYENVIITDYIPTITNIYDISFTLKLSYNSLLGRSSKRNSKGYHIINANVNQEVVNMLAQEEYLGQGKVEEVTIEDTAMIEAFKKAMNLTKVKVQGEYI